MFDNVRNQQRSERPVKSRFDGVSNGFLFISLVLLLNFSSLSSGLAITGVWGSYPRRERKRVSRLFGAQAPNDHYSSLFCCVEFMIYLLHSVAFLLDQ